MQKKHQKSRDALFSGDQIGFSFMCFQMLTPFIRSIACRAAATNCSFQWRSVRRDRETRLRLEQAARANFTKPQTGRTDDHGHVVDDRT